MRKGKARQGMSFQGKCRSSMGGLEMVWSIDDTLVYPMLC